MCVESGTFAELKQQFNPQFFNFPYGPSKLEVPAVTIFLNDELVETLLQELRALSTEQRSAAEIDFGNLTCGCESEVANRGKFV